MPQIRKVMNYCGLQVGEVCIKCKYLNPKAEEHYMCHVPGHCPSFLTEDEKSYLLENWNPIEIEEPTFDEKLEEHYTREAQSIADRVDADILAEMISNNQKDKK